MLKGIKLRDYQNKVLNELDDVPSIGLFIKTGGGKTIMSLERFMRNGTDNLLVICPQKIITQWWETIESTTDLKPIKYNLSWNSTKKNKTIGYYLVDKSIIKKCVVINYENLKKIDCIDLFINDNWTIIVDESHRIKSVGTKKKPIQATKRVLDLGKLTPYKIILTATPTEKENGGYIDLYSQLKFLGYIDYSLDYFKSKYCVEDKIQIPGMPFPIKKIVGYKVREINNSLMPILKNTCKYYAPKYGEYEPQVIDIKIPRCKSYSKLLRERAYEDITFDNVSAFRIGKKSLIGGKITGTNEYGDRFEYVDNTEKIEWLEEFLTNTDDKVSILYNLNVEKDMIISVCEKLKKKYIVINGDVIDKPRELKKDFDIVIGQYKAFSESLDGLQYKCHIMVFYSMPDSSLSYKQSLGRIDRIGQTEMPIYYNLVMQGTIDIQICNMLRNKIEFSEKDLNMLGE